ncbi:MAG TPA: phosphatase PAP2 family protein [Propionibacteriaceae bacterium]|nr:phosphatase PAP2 family protein [Propionibacteriaceae bacterium]
MFNAVPRQHTTWFRLSGGFLGSEVVLAVGGVALTLVVGLRRRRFRHLVVGLATAAASVVAAELLKHVLLSRPSTAAPAAVSNSFPSGHTAVAAAVTVALWFVVSPRWRPAVVIVGGLLCALVGVVTVVQQWHRPSDAVSAYALVAACACAGGAALVPWQGPPDRGSPGATAN